jgi:geranylgeranyl reductase family protein
MSDLLSADVAIVGAGPAGTRAAYLLARAGARVTVFDGSHPREKPCGGGVTGRALALVADAIDVRVLDAIVVDGAQFAGDGSSSPAMVSLTARGASAESDLIVMSRQAFDRALLEAAIAAGAKHVAARVTNVAVERDCVRLDTGGRQGRVPFVIGADGANSLVRRRLSRPFARAQLSTATGFFAHGMSSSSIAIKFTVNPAGYLWSFPRPDHLAIGACAQAHETSVQVLRDVTTRWMDEAQLASGARLERYAWPIPSLGPADFAAERPAGSRWMLVGDAGGLVDPITREGIFFALRSGELAAKTLQRDAPRPDMSYAGALRREIYPELARAARLKEGFFRGRFIRLVIDALHRSPAVRGVMADLVAGRQPYATLKRRLVTTFELGLAWQLLRLELGFASSPARDDLDVMKDL